MSLSMANRNKFWRVIFENNILHQKSYLICTLKYFHNINSKNKMIKWNYISPLKLSAFASFFLFSTLLTAASYTLPYSGLGFFLSPLSWILGFFLLLSALTWTFGFVLPALSWTLTRLSKSPMSWFSWSSTIKLQKIWKWKVVCHQIKTLRLLSDDCNFKIPWFMLSSAIMVPTMSTINVNISNFMLRYLSGIFCENW